MSIQKLNSDLSPLDYDLPIQNLEIDSYIKFTLKDYNDKLIFINLPYEKIQLFKNCDFCVGITNPKFKKTFEVDLKDYYYISFNIILQYLETNVLPVLSLEYDLIDLKNLAQYLGIDSTFIEYITFDDEYIFLNSLTSIDFDIIQSERKLRKKLYSYDSKELNENDIFKLNEIDESHKIQNVWDTIPNIENPEHFDPYKGSNPQNLLKQITPDYIGIKSRSYLDRKKPDLERYFRLDLNIYKMILKKLDYKGYIVAGGWYYNQKYRKKEANDIDLFLIDRNPDSAVEIIVNIYNTIIQIKNELFEIYSNLYPDYLELFQYFFKPPLLTLNSNCLNISLDCYSMGVYSQTLIQNQIITFGTRNLVPYSDSRYINIQIITRLYNNISQVITGFDVDSSCIAYNGKDLYCNTRFVRSIKYKYVIVDPERQSKNYSHRLRKYSNRGFDIIFPGLNLDRINYNFLKNTNNTGLSKIIFEFLTKLNSHKSISDYEIDYNLYNLNNIHNYIRKLCLKDIFIKTNETDISAYIKEYDLYFLYIYDYTSRSTSDRESELAVKRYLNSNKIKIGFKFGYNLNNILFDNTYTPDSNYFIPDFMEFESELPKKIRFKIKNVGTQYTNSFHPTSDEWYSGLYLSNDNINKII